MGEGAGPVHLSIRWYRSDGAFGLYPAPGATPGGVSLRSPAHEDQVRLWLREKDELMISGLHPTANGAHATSRLPRDLAIAGRSAQTLELGCLFVVTDTTTKIAGLRHESDLLYGRPV